MPPKKKIASAQVKSKVDAPLLVEKRRAQFIEAAIDLFGQRGYHVTTIRDIAQAAGVSIGLIYQYVEDKEDILFLALMQVLDQYINEIPPVVEQAEGPLQKIIAAVGAYIHIIDGNVNATVLAYRETKSLRKERRLLIQQKELESNALITDCLEQGIAAGLFAADTDVEMVTYQIVMFAHAWALKAWRFRSMMSVDEYINRGLKMILNAALTPKGKRLFISLQGR
jgi:AcrR family transcriptional regulator